MKANETVKKECIYIAYCCTILSVLMQAVFVVCKRWEYTVLLGNLLSLVASVLNFYFMGLTVQKAVEKDESDAKKLMKSSSSVRTAVLFVIIAIGVALPWFNTVAVIVPVFFPRIAIMLRPFIKDKKGSDK
ncbi:MAG: ATP synthase subunit I [Clostridia bacterium]|nr:ATP synthase subunit I [Clostridia bacterium]